MKKIGKYQVWNLDKQYGQISSIVVGCPVGCKGSFVITNLTETFQSDIFYSGLELGQTVIISDDHFFEYFLHIHMVEREQSGQTSLHVTQCTQE